MDVTVHSVLPLTCHEALERLVYFNRQQRRAKDAIVQVVETYGSLDIISSADGLRVAVSRRGDAQCLFAMNRRKGQLELAAGLIYLRTSPEDIVVLHIAVADTYGRNRRIALHLVLRLVRSVRAISHRLRGVRRVTVLYRGNRFEMTLKTSEPAPIRAEMVCT